MKGKTIKFPEENRGEYFHNFRDGQRFLKEGTIKNKADSLDHIKVKSTLFNKKYH